MPRGLLARESLAHSLRPHHAPQIPRRAQGGRRGEPREGAANDAVARKSHRGSSPLRHHDGEDAAVVAREHGRDPYAQRAVLQRVRAPRVEVRVRALCEALPAEEADDAEHFQLRDVAPRDEADDLEWEDRDEVEEEPTPQVVHRNPPRIAHPLCLGGAGLDVEQPELEQHVEQKEQVVVGRRPERAR